MKLRNWLLFVLMVILCVRATFLGWRLLGESYTAELLLGSALTLGGVYILNRTGNKKNVEN